MLSASPRRAALGRLTDGTTLLAVLETSAGAICSRAVLRKLLHLTLLEGASFLAPCLLSHGLVHRPSRLAIGYASLTKELPMAEIPAGKAIWPHAVRVIVPLIAPQDCPPRAIARQLVAREKKTVAHVTGSPLSMDTLEQQEGLIR